MGKVIAITNQKGGVGKTTTALNVGVGLKNLGKKVLMIDMDPQANLTSASGFKNQAFDATIFDVLGSRSQLLDTVVVKEGVEVVPSSIALSNAESELASTPGREFLLKESIDEAKKVYDLVLLDCPPTLGLLTWNSLIAADEVMIPIQAEYLPLEGVKYLVQTVELVKRRFNPDLEISGVIITLFDPRQNLQKEVVESVRGYFQGKVFNSFIRRNVALAEAPSFGQDIYSYRRDSAGAKDYLNLCKEIVKKRIV
jgi:chromosome partitioning protein